MLLGTNPYAPILLRTLGFVEPAAQIPRLRDCYMDSEGNVAILTRTGGPNRASHAEENSHLEKMPGFLRTEDWDLDGTFAKWIYAPPAQHAELLKQLATMGATMDPTEAFNAALADMKSDNPKPSTRAALERTRPLMEQLTSFLQQGSVAVLDSDYKVQE